MLRLLRFQPLRDRAVGDFALDGFDGDRIFVKVQRAGRLARRRADPAGHFREIVGRVQVARGLVPLAAINEVVPVRDLVVDRAAGRLIGDEIGAVAIRDAAVHAARRLLAHLRLGKRQHELTVMLHALRDWLVVAVVTLEFEEAGNLAHYSAACIAAASFASSASARRYSTGMTLRNLPQ